MGYKCAAYNCKSGYAGQKNEPNITFHSFPLKDKDLLQSWLSRIARKDFVPTKHSKLCSRHFKMEDFIDVSVDKTVQRKRKRTDVVLLRRRLKPQVIPSVFEGMFKHYTRKDTPFRSGVALSSSKLDKEASLIEQQNEQFLDADKLTSFENFICSLSNEPQCKGFVMQQTEKGLNIMHLTEEEPPQILTTIFIDRCFKVKVYNDQHLLPLSAYRHIVSSDNVSLLSQVTNLMAFAKDISHCSSASQPQTELQENFIKLAETYMEESQNEQEIALLKFIMEQIDLLFTNKHHRRYSPELLLMSYIIHATSAKAYERLLDEQLLILPSVKTLRKITMNLDRRTAIGDTEYLRMRNSKVNAFDRNVLLMIDEIYVSKRIECTGGQVFGLTEGCEVAATALCFMIKSLSSGYKDMIGIFPVRNLRAQTQKECFDKVIALVHEVGFNVIGISVDNAPANRKFFKEFLCKGSLTEFVQTSTQFMGALAQIVHLLV